MRKARNEHPPRWVRRFAEFRPLEERSLVPPNTRGFCALLRYRPKLDKYDVVYVGMANTGIRARLRRHAASKSKRDLWTHFSAFEVWPNITEEEIRELEGLLRHIFRKDTRANRLNRQRGFKRLRRVRINNLSKWAANQ